MPTHQSKTPKPVCETTIYQMGSLATHSRVFGTHSVDNAQESREAV